MTCGCQARVCLDCCVNNLYVAKNGFVATLCCKCKAFPIWAEAADLRAGHVCRLKALMALASTGSHTAIGKCCPAPKCKRRFIIRHWPCVEPGCRCDQKFGCCGSTITVASAVV